MGKSVTDAVTEQIACLVRIVHEPWTKGEDQEFKATLEAIARLRLTSQADPPPASLDLS